MNRDDVIHLRDCITAWLSGDIIEEKSRKESTQNIAEWTPYEGDHVPLFNMEEYLYREKPKPREFYVRIRVDDDQVLTISRKPMTHYEGCVEMKVREVLS